MSDARATPAEAEARMRELIQASGLREPDSVEHEDDEVLLFWWEEKLVVIVELTG